MATEVQYAHSGDVFIAYDTFGVGARDLLLVMDGFIPIDTMDDEPRLARGLRRLASFTRVIRFDRRGIGLSDPISLNDPPTLEQWVDDAMAVLDAAGSGEAVVLAAAEASPVAILAAAMHPERVSALVVVNGFPRVLSDVDYPGLSAAELEELLDTTNPTGPPTAESIARFVPSAAHDEQFRLWWYDTGRRGASPSTARALLRVALESDVRDVLAAVRVPVLVITLRDAMEASGSSYLAQHIRGARHVELPGADGYWWAADAAHSALDEIEEFLTGVRTGRHHDRRLMTLLFTDIVGSTERTSALGDATWREVLDRHDAMVRRQLARFQGCEVNTTGDGFLATFDGPARAIDCACAIRDASGQLGLNLRSGIHTGEVEARGSDITGIAVDIAARVAALSEPGEVWTTRTVVDLVAGSGLRFVEQGSHTLKGVPGTWALFVVES